MPERFNLALIFPEDFSSMIQKFRHRLVQESRQSSGPSEASRAHITIVQFDATTDAVDMLWRRLRARWTDRVLVDLSGITLLPSSNGGAWVEISVLKSRALENLQELACEFLHDLEPVNETGDSYRPHITLARFEEGSLPPSLPLDYSILRARAVPTTIAIGRGTHFDGSPVAEWHAGQQKGGGKR